MGDSRRRTATLGVLVIAGTVLHSASEASDDFRVIVEASNPASSLAPRELRLIFLKKTLRWPDGTEVLPVDLSMRSPVRWTFSREILRLPSVQSYWVSEMEAGRSKPPPVKTSDLEVIEFVAAQPGSIGYVSTASELPKSVKILRIVEPK